MLKHRRARLFHVKNENSLWKIVDSYARRVYAVYRVNIGAFYQSSLQIIKLRGINSIFQIQVYLPVSYSGIKKNSRQSNNLNYPISD